MAKGEKFIVNGGGRLNGEIENQGAKNFALQAMAIALLTDEDVVLTNVPNIEDIQTVISIQEDMGVKVSGKGTGSLTINASGLNFGSIDPLIAMKITGSRYFIPVGVKRLGEFTSGPSGGDQIGGDDRYTMSKKVREFYKQMGIESAPFNGSDGFERYKFSEAMPQDSVMLEQRFFGPTVQTLLMRSLDRDEREFKIFNPSVEPEIFATIDLLKSMGADISYSPKDFKDGKDSINITGVKKLRGTTFNVMSDPNSMVSYAAAALATNGEVQIGKVEANDKTAGFVHQLNEMNASFAYNPENQTLTIGPSLTRIQPMHLTADFWPSYCHTDWQQLLTPVLARVEGLSFVYENVTKQRFTAISTLAQMGGVFELIYDSQGISNEGFKTDNLPHGLKIKGPVNFHGEKVLAPDDVRGATSVLIAALSASGISEISGIKQIDRGLQNIDQKLNSLGAKITRV